jgi:hypothetical protein
VFAFFSLLQKLYRDQCVLHQLGVPFQPIQNPATDSCLAELHWWAGWHHPRTPPRASNATAGVISNPVQSEYAAGESLPQQQQQDQQTAIPGEHQAQKNQGGQAVHQGQQSMAGAAAGSQVLTATAHLQ